MEIQVNVVVLLMLFQRLSIMFRSFLFDFFHHLSSTASLSLSQLFSAPKFFKILLVQSPNFLSVGSLQLSVKYRTLCCVMLAIVYHDNQINYVITVLR